MKYATIAALVAVAAAADKTDSGCKADMKFEIFSDDKCADAVEGKDGSHTVTKDEMKAFEDMPDCMPAGEDGAVKATCKADGLHIKMYKDAKCETESLSTTIEWGKCHANP